MNYCRECDSEDCRRPEHAQLPSPDSLYSHSGEDGADLPSPDSLYSHALEVPMWPVLNDDALHGLVGEIVATLAPHTESDPAALAITTLVHFGCAADANRYAIADAARHPARLFAVLVGKTSRARKGTAQANVKRIFEIADEAFTREHIFGGLSSGEGLMYVVRDGADEEDPGILDKRLLAYEPEFARVLSACERRDSTLSATIRQAWDGDTIRTLTRHNPLKATGTHICAICHITAEELRRSLTATQKANGFANRFLYVLVKRSQRLPSGGNLEQAAINQLGAKIAHALQAARLGHVLHRSREAESLWREFYNAIDDDIDGMFGAITARAEAQMLRLSVCYALLDTSERIELAHLRAAKAMWDYCEDSARWLFGDTLGDDVADKLLTAIRKAGLGGLDGSQQHALFQRHVSLPRLNAARQALETRGLVKVSTEVTGGRPREVTYAVPPVANKANHANKAETPDPIIATPPTADPEGNR